MAANYLKCWMGEKRERKAKENKTKRIKQYRVTRTVSNVRQRMCANLAQMSDSAKKNIFIAHLEHEHKLKQLHNTLISLWVSVFSFIGIFLLQINFHLWNHIYFFFLELPQRIDTVTNPHGFAFLLSHFLHSFSNQLLYGRKLRITIINHNWLLGRELKNVFDVPSNE